MATKKKVAKKKVTATKKAGNKGQGPDGKFIKGNKVAEKWTEQVVIRLLKKMWKTITEGHDEQQGNYVRANDIKTLMEVCLIHDMDPDTWAYIKEKHKDSPSVMRLIKKILWVLEARLIYSGTTMDIFTLKHHYEYTDRKQVDHTTKGESINDNGVDHLSVKEKLELIRLRQKMNGSSGA